jgi:hypothetical protein
VSGVTGTDVLEQAGLDVYERDAVEEIRAWARRDRTKVDRTIAASAEPIDQLFDRLMENEDARRTIEKVMERSIDRVRQWASDSTDPQEVLSKHDGASSLADLLERELSELDEAADGLRSRYVSGIVAIGAAEAGASIFNPVAALTAIAAGVPAMLGTAFRATAEHAQHYGFDPDDPAERDFEARVLSVAVEVTDERRNAALEALQDADPEEAKEAAKRQMEKHALMTTVHATVKGLTLALTRRKVAQAVPVIGIAAASGFNAHFAHRVCEASSQLYRARFLAQRHGVPLRAVVQPA